MSFYGKVFKYEREENYDAYVESFGLPDDEKNYLLSYKPDQKFEKDGDNYTHVLYNRGEEQSFTFKIGEEFEDNVAPKPVKNIYTIDGNTVTHVMKFGKNFDDSTTVTKEFSGNKMVETMKNKKWNGTAKLYYSA